MFAPGSEAGALTLEQAERQMIQRVLAQHEGNISRVAKALGLSRAALYRRLEKHGLSGSPEPSPVLEYTSRPSAPGRTS